MLFMAKVEIDMNFLSNVCLCLPGIQTLDSLQTQTSLRILMEGVQTQLKERYNKNKWLYALGLGQDILVK